MKRKYIPLKLLVLIGFLVLGSCGPIILSSRPSTPPPSWFYPDRVEIVRYVYFPEYLIYYDLSMRNYIYLENGIWITVKVLPQRFQNVNLRGSRFIRVKDYYGDRIDNYHRDNRGRSNKDIRSNRGRRNTDTKRSRG